MEHAQGNESTKILGEWRIALHQADGLGIAPPAGDAPVIWHKGSCL